MSKLPLVTAKQLENFLFSLGFIKKRKKEVTLFINTRMDVIPQFHIILIKYWPVI